MTFVKSKLSDEFTLPASRMKARDSEDTYLVVSHDAGGAEIVSSWVKHHPKNAYRFVLEGPAIAIFTKKLSNDIVIYPRDALPALISECDVLLAGTSGEADLERFALTLCKRNLKPTIAMLDHWCEFKERFDVDLPDEIWVSDVYAYEIAKECFPNLTIKCIENYYLKDFNSLLSSATSQSYEPGLKILYICEPITDYAKNKYNDANYFQYTEYEALSYFFEILLKIQAQCRSAKIRLRTHPLEEISKYNSIIESTSFMVDISGDTLIEDLLWADWVVGCSSMALIQAAYANKKVFTCIPPKANVFKFPHCEIKPLSTMTLE